MLNSTGLAQKYLLSGKDVYLALQKSNKISKTGILILGDSVAHQLYPSEKADINYESLACNQAVSLIGHYILLENYLMANENTKAIYLVYHPDSFSNRLDQAYTFNYFFKPFYLPANHKFFTPRVLDIISRVHSRKLLDLPVVRYTNVALGFEDSLGEKKVAYDRYTPSDISIEYLQKIKILAAKRNIKVRVVSPVLDVKYARYSSEQFMAIINDNGLNDMFEGYFNFRYLDSSNFSDTIHYTRPDSLGVNPLSLAW